MEDDFFEPTLPTKVWKIPYFFFEPFPKSLDTENKFLNPIFGYRVKITPDINPMDLS